MYFINAVDQSTDHSHGMSVARSALATPGGPGDWWLYNESCPPSDRYCEPGLGGEATKLHDSPKIQNAQATTFASSATGHEHVALLWFDCKGQAFGVPDLSGVNLAFSSRPEGPFTTLKEPLIPLKAEQPCSWAKPPRPTEVYGYASAVPMSGGHTWSDHFVMFYLYVAPEEYFDRRYFLRRHVRIWEGTAPAQRPQVLIQLTRSRAPDAPDHWTTTAYKPGYSGQDLQGLIMTRPPAGAGSVELVDCVNPAAGDPSHADHLIARDACPDGDGYLKLRTLGWAHDSPQTDTVPLHRCHDPLTGDHLTSLDAACEGLGTSELILGYVYPN
jgi:hypothetical protein